MSMNIRKTIPPEDYLSKNRIISFEKPESSTKVKF